MTDMAKTLRHTFTVQVEIDPGVWERNYYPESVQDDSRDHLAQTIQWLIEKWLADTGNTGQVRHLCWERSGPGVPIENARWNLRKGQRA